MRTGLASTVLGAVLVAACSVGSSPVQPGTDDVDTLPDGSAGHDASVNDGSADGGADGSVAPDSASMDAAAADAASVDSGASDSASQPDSGCASACGVRSVCVRGTCSAARRVFVSTTASGANLGGHAGADAECASLASAQSLGGTWMAWVSDSNSSPSTRFTQSTDPYRLLNGFLVSNNWNDLTSGSISNPIDRDETGAVANGETVWTSTASDGADIGGGAGCNDFSSSSSSGGAASVGSTSGTDITWTESTADTCDDTSPHIYCFEQ